MGHSSGQMELLTTATVAVVAGEEGIKTKIEA